MAPPLDSRVALIVAGGTGGHLYPGIAVAHALLKKAATSASDPGWTVQFAVRKGDMGKALLEREGFSVLELSGQGLPRKLSPRTVAFPFKVGMGYLQARSAIRRLKPRVVLGMGGYLSFPVVLAARGSKIPTIIHEQNVLPGLANKLLGRLADSAAVSFPESEKYFPPKKVWVAGLPIRPDIGTVPAHEAHLRFGLSEGKTTVLVFGGSQGARRLNESVVGAWQCLGDLRSAVQVLHVTGERDYAHFNELYASLPVRAVVMPYCHDMAAAYAAADLVICRAGASTVAELIVARKPSILVPYPFASEDHQVYNAEILVRMGVAEAILEAQFSPELLAERLRAYLQHPARFQKARERFTHAPAVPDHPRAASLLAEYLFNLG